MYTYITNVELQMCFQIKLGQDITIILINYVRGGDNLQNWELKSTHLGLCEHNDSKDICFLDFFDLVKFTPYQAQIKIFQKISKMSILQLTGKILYIYYLSIYLALKAQFFHLICQITAEKLIFQIILVSCLAFLFNCLF